MILFHDFEVFRHDWILVVMNMDEQQKTVFVNDPDGLKRFYEEHKNDIWIGYNNRHYDQYILKSILCGFDPYEVNQFIIEDGNAGWMYSNLFNKIKLYSYDVMGLNESLKSLEGMMGNNIHETDVDFRIQRKLTDSEIQKEIEYCKSDVMNTVEVFMERKSDFLAQMNMIKIFGTGLNGISKTKVQLSAEILKATKHTWNDEFDIHIPDTAIVRKYTQVVEWFKDSKNHHYKDGKKGHKLNTIMAGCPMVFGWGGAHGALPNYHEKGYFVNMDVSSLYPSLWCVYPQWCASRSMSKEGLQKYTDIKAYRLKLKAEGKKKEQAPYKIILNGSYGATKDKTNPLFDPRGANNTCVFGQILVGVDLLERLEETGVCKIIQVNTDGILVKMNRYEDYDIIDDVAAEWEQRTGLELEFDDYGFGEVWQKDVNNYVIIDGYDGHYKSKGAYVKQLSRLDCDLPIVNEALVNFMVHKIPIETTINQCDELLKFQMIRKISSKYEYVKHGDKVLKEKCNRIFASRSEADGQLFKKKLNGSFAKLEGTPVHAFIDNSDIHGKTVPPKLDKGWYIETAKERLKGFGS